MFTLEKPDTVTWPVTIRIPSDGGKTRKASFDAEFKLLDQDEIDAALAGSQDDIEFICRVTAGWSHVQDEDGNELPFSGEACQRMAKIPYVRKALMKAFWDATLGAVEKN